MPKSYITREQRQQAQFSAWLYGAMKTTGITQSQLAERMGIAQASLNRKLKNQHFSYSDLLVIFDTFEPDRDELATLLGMNHHREYRRYGKT